MTSSHLVTVQSEGIAPALPADVSPLPAPAPAARPNRRRRRLSPGLVLAILFLGWVTVASLAPQLLTSVDPLEVSPANSFLPPGPGHIFGTDESGSDVYSRIVHGTGTSLLIGLAATAIGVVFGTIIGLIAGLSNRVVESAVMRFLDVTLAVPELLLALVVIALIGGGTLNAILAIGAAGIAYYARLVRAQTHIVRQSAYVEAASTLGFSRLRVIVTHVLPNAIKPVLVLATIGIGGAIGAGASLSFLGLGTPPPAPEWGAMLSVGRNFISNAPWLILVPSAFLVATVLAITAIGRELRRRSEGRVSR
ncbi:ABC transporter permease [Mycetocola zhadangensis]|uniref:ABC transporter permease n=1 Tax=Mycetocola zhadangensis TaxID=1164595 RepID=A0A3L7IWY0_9MICO|nr:ABC transporter permease [Mycetocola zhadangensis]RLQ82640.1 ABC transporter permease [Mycetocola zhadangensis]GGE99571.1 ABC transporter permease [Mycetocola zhadangensis]